MAQIYASRYANFKFWEPIFVAKFSPMNLRFQQLEIGNIVTNFLHSLQYNTLSSDVSIG